MCAQETTGGSLTRGAFHAYNSLRWAAMALCWFCFVFFFSLSLPREKTRAPRSQWVDLLAGRAWNERLSSLSLGRGSRTLAVANANASAMLVILSSPPAAAAAAAAAAGVRCQHRHRQQVWCSALARFFFSSPPSLSSSYSFLKVASRERSASGESRE